MNRQNRFITYKQFNGRSIFEFDRSESSLSLKSDDEGREAGYDKSKTATATNVNPHPFMRHDATYMQAWSRDNRAE